MKIDMVVKSVYGPRRIDSYLAETLVGEISRAEIKKCLDSDMITLNDKTAKPRDTVNAGDHIVGELTVVKKYFLEPDPIPIHVVYEDASLLVVDKPVGLVVHPGAGHKRGTLVNALVARNTTLSSVGTSERPGIVHRLDKDTSGLLLVAKTNRAHRVLQSQFASRSLSKIYFALVKGRIEYEEGHVTQPIGRDPKVRLKFAVSQLESAKEAETLYKVIKRFRSATLLELKLITGRTHQIRVHMAYLNHPVMGDKLYGRLTDPSPRMALHAAKIEFEHPVSGKVMRFESPMPADMKKMIEACEKE